MSKKYLIYLCVLACLPTFAAITVNQFSPISPENFFELKEAICNKRATLPISIHVESTEPERLALFFEVVSADNAWYAEGNPDDPKQCPKYLSKYPTSEITVGPRDPMTPATLLTAASEFTQRFYSEDFCADDFQEISLRFCLYDGESSPKFLKATGVTLDFTPADPPNIANIVAGDKRVILHGTNNLKSPKFQLCLGDGDIPAEPEGDGGAAAGVGEKGGGAAADPGDGDAAVRPKIDTCQILDPSQYSIKASSFKNDLRESSFIIGNLQNDKKYFFQIKVAGNESWSDPVAVTPEGNDTFWSEYDGEPNNLSFGCATSRTPSADLGLLVFGLGFLSLMRRRKHLSHLILCGCIAVILPTTIFAEGPKAGEFNIGISGSPYRPNIDAALTNKVYQCIFGAPDYEVGGPLIPRIGLDADYHITNAFGSFLVGAGASLAWANGFARKSGTFSGSSCGTKIDEADQTLFIYELKPQVTYILDPWINKFPLAPYVRAGIIAAGYTTLYQEGLDDKGGKKNGPSGFRFGYEAAVGLIFNLDLLDQSGVTTARATSSYNRSYLKAELAYSRVDNFHQGGGIDLSPVDIMGTGLPLIFNFGLVVEFQ